MVGFIEMQQLCYISHFVWYLTQNKGAGGDQAGGAGLYSQAPVVE